MSVLSLLSPKAKANQPYAGNPSKPSKSSKPSTARPSMLWWLVGLVLFGVCVVIQMPAAWLVQKFAPNHDNIQWVSGNLWQGALSWQMPMQGKPPLAGSLEWQWQPSQLLLARLGAEVQVVSGGTRLQGKVARGFGGWQMVDVSGRIGVDTLQTLVGWQVPNAPIAVKRVDLAYDKDIGFDNADGMMSWAGGTMGYPSGGRVFEIALPAMTAPLSTKKVTADNANNNANNTATDSKQQALQLQLLDENSKRLGELVIDAGGMVDVSLTQRLLEHMPDYQGSAPKDSVVVTVRQPLLSGMSSPDASNLDALQMQQGGGL